MDSPQRYGGGAVGRDLERAPSWRDDAAWILRSPRSAFRLRTLLATWPWLLVLEAMGRHASEVPAKVGFCLVLSLGGVCLAAWVSLCAAAEASADDAPGWKELARGLRRSAPPLLLAAAMTLAIPALLGSLALAGGLLSRIPWAGGALWMAWAATGGLVLCFAAAGWLVVGLPALLLQPAASAIEVPFGFDLVSRTTSYVRRRPLRLAGGLVLAAVSSLLGTMAFALFLLLGLTLLEGIRDVAVGYFPDLLFNFQAVLAFAAGRDGPWPLGPWLPDANDGTVLAAVGMLPSWVEPMSRLAPAFLVASLFAGLTRLYLILRREIDGTSVDRRDAREKPAVPSSFPEGTPPAASPAG